MFKVFSLFITLCGINFNKQKSTIMQITDFDINASNNTFTIERDDVQWGEVKIKDFFDFMAEWKGWFFDVSERTQFFVVIPDEEMVYNKEVGSFLCNTANVRVHTWDSFCKDHSTKLTDYFTAYAEASDDEIEWEEAEDYIDEDPQAEAYADFRRAQNI